MSWGRKRGQQKHLKYLFWVGEKEGGRGAPWLEELIDTLLTCNKKFCIMKTRKRPVNTSGRQRIVELPEWGGKKKNDQQLLSVVPSFSLSFFSLKKKKFLLLWKLLNIHYKRRNNTRTLHGPKARVHCRFFFLSQREHIVQNPAIFQFLFFPAVYSEFAHLQKSALLFIDREFFSFSSYLDLQQF